MNREHLFSHALMDWDGTMQDSLSVWLEETMAALLKRGISSNKRYVAQHVVPRLTNAKELGVTDIDDFIIQIVAQSVLQLAQTPIDMSLWNKLVELQAAGVKIAVVSTSESKIINSALEYHGLTKPPFNHIICSDTEALNGLKKPNPAPLAHAMKLLGYDNKSKPIMMGDSLVDIQAGKNYGCDTILYCPPRNKPFYDLPSLLKHEPTYHVSSVDEIDAIFFSQNNHSS